MLKKVLDDRGAGLILVLVVCSLVGAAAVFLMNMSGDTDKKLHNDAKVLSYYTLVQNVKQTLHNGNMCTAALSTQNLIVPASGSTPAQSAFTKEGVSVALDIGLGVNKKIIKKAEGKDVWFINGGTSVKDVKLHIYEKVRAPVRLAKTPLKQMNAALGYIVIEPGHPGVGPRLLRNRSVARIPLFIYYSATGGGNYRIDYCGPPDGSAYFCTIFGGGFDSTETDEFRKCNPDVTCIAWKAGLVSNVSECQAPFSAYPIGYVPAQGGQLYMCDWCNPHGTPPTPHRKGFLFIPQRPHPTQEAMDQEWLNHQPQVPIVGY